ncbi:uncharacterized, partial [Tachysurus ichikawai]
NDSQRNNDDGEEKNAVTNSCSLETDVSASH